MKILFLALLFSLQVHAAPRALRKAAPAQAQNEAAASDSVDKSQYSLFNPTPENEMREFDSDRPGATDSAHTVDAGHFRFESEIYSYDVEHDSKTKSFNDFYLIAGLTSNAEAQVGWQSFLSEKAEDMTTNGVGDVRIRLKTNLFGNDDVLAVATIFAVKIPTATRGLGSNKMDGAFSVPLSFNLVGGFDISIMPEWDFIDGDHIQFYSAFQLGHDFLESFTGFIQYFSTSVADERSPASQMSGIGVTYRPNKNMQFDIGLNWSVVAPALEYEHMGGIVYRL